MAPVDVATVARETLDLYEDIAEDRGASLATSVPEHIAVQADRPRLRQVLANLVDNGIKYTPSGGRVTISASATGERVTISVSDTGIGIAEGDIGRIWERLYRADQSRGEAGLGLGLSLVAAIVSAHGGEVGVDSEPGRGSVFRIGLPAAGLPAAPAAGSAKYEVQSTKYGEDRDI
jgi:signal transduction histidine kinase